MATQTPKTVRYQTKQEMVYHTLRDAIVRCELPPGRRLIIEDIAAQLHVSHIPVREALHLLQSEGLIVNVPHVGATVAPISEDALFEVFTMMEGLELVATRIAAPRLTPEHLAHFDRLLAAMDKTVERNAREEFADLNTQFHRSIAQITNMPMLQETTDRVFDQWDRIRRYFASSVLLSRMDQAQQEHHALIQALRDHDDARLEQIVKQHNRSALEAYAAVIEQTEQATPKP